MFNQSIHSGSITFANWFELPSFHTDIIQDHKEVLPDHESLISTIYLLKWAHFDQFF